jgi:hypothetical protein
LAGQIRPDELETGSISYTCEALSNLKGKRQVVEAVVHTAHKMGMARLASIICYFSSDFCGAWHSRFRTRRICTEHSEKRRNRFPLTNVHRGNFDIGGLWNKTLYLSMPFLPRNPSLRMSTCSQEPWKRWDLSKEVLQDMGCDYGLRDDTIYALGNYCW